MNTLQEILARRAELLNDVTKRSQELSLEEITSINKELDELEKQEKEIRAKQALDERMKNMSIPTNTVERKDEQVSTNPEVSKRQELAKRGAMYKARLGTEIALRSSVEGSTQDGVLIPSHLSDAVQPYPWNEVSTVLDLVNVISLPNGNEYTETFQTETGEGNYTLEPTKTGTASDDGIYTEVDTKFDQVVIKRNKITALTYMSEELSILPEADYATLVERNVSLALKKKLAKEVILGDGTGNHFVGMASKESSNMNANTYEDKEYAIDENTLFDMLVDFGGAEDVESTQVLLLNKQTLKDFKKVRGTDKRPVYDISITGNTFTIDGYRGVFSSHIKPYSTATGGDIWAIYADLSKYDLLNFGGEVIETSREFKFNQGITAVRGKVYAGGGLAGYKAFLRATKKAE